MDRIEQQSLAGSEIWWLIGLTVGVGILTFAVVNFMSDEPTPKSKRKRRKR